MKLNEQLRLTHNNNYWLRYMQDSPSVRNLLYPKFYIKSDDFFKKYSTYRLFSRLKWKIGGN